MKVSSIFGCGQKMATKGVFEGCGFNSGPKGCPETVFRRRVAESALTFGSKSAFMAGVRGNPEKEDKLKKTDIGVPLYLKV
jgi:hypothetical protein